MNKFTCTVLLLWYPRKDEWAWCFLIVNRLKASLKMNLDVVDFYVSYLSVHQEREREMYAYVQKWLLALKLFLLLLFFCMTLSQHIVAFGEKKTSWCCLWNLCLLPLWKVIYIRYTVSTVLYPTFFSLFFLYRIPHFMTVFYKSCGVVVVFFGNC